MASWRGELINRGIQARWPDAQGQRVLGVGYPTPYLGLFREHAERCIAFMPAAQGVLKWPTARPALATLVDEYSMPLADAAVDRILLVHALEISDNPEGLLREVWRVLAPSGRMMAIIPNRRGVWTRTDNTPFGHGRPYSRSQITQLLRQTWFTPTGWGEALFMPPVAGGWFLRSAMAWERAGAAMSLPFAGVHIVEATKQVYRAIPAHRERTRLIPALRPVLVPSRCKSGASRRTGTTRSSYSFPGLKSSPGVAGAEPGRRDAGRAAGGGGAAGNVRRHYCLRTPRCRR